MDKYEVWVCVTTEKMWTYYLMVDAKVAALPRLGVLAPVVGFHMSREQAHEQDAYCCPSGHDLKRFSWKTPFESKTLFVECQSSSVFKTVTISHYITIRITALTSIVDLP